MKITFFTLLCFCFFFIKPGDAQPTAGDTSALVTAERPLRFPLISYPFTFRDGYFWPSYTQSINITKNIHQIVSRSIHDLAMDVHPVWGPVITTVGIFGFDFVHNYVPTGTGWQHQEAHRAILYERGYKGFNQAFQFNLFQMRLALQKIPDQALFDMKKDHNDEYNRLRGAGHEGQQEMMNGMKKDAFVYDTPGWINIPTYFFNTFVVITFVREFKEDDYDQLIDERNRRELTIEERDISGVEFTPLVYDMFRPNEPYDERGEFNGVHEYGPGVDRYIGNSDMTVEEIAYLGKQAKRVFVSALSPALFGFPRFKGKNPFNDREMFWNFNVLHNFVGFGTTIDVMFFFKQDDWNLFFTWHNFENRFNYFPGFDLEIMRYPLEKLFVSGTIGLWLQPEDQLFQTTKSEPGGIIKLGIDVPFWGDFEWSLFSEFKSYGYVSGITPLQPAVQFHTGINWRY